MPDAADDHVAVAISHLSAGRLREAVQAAQSALALRPDQPDALHLLGLVAWRMNQLDQAAQLIRACLAVAPGFAEGHKNLGKILYQAHHLADAIAHLSRAVELQPDFSEAMFFLAAALRESGDVGRAVELYRRLVMLRPDDAEVHHELGATLKDAGQLEEAIAAFRKAATLDPNHALAQVNLGSALLQHGDPETARAPLERAIALDPNRADARMGYCLSLLPIGYRSEAEIDDSRARYAAALEELGRFYDHAAQETLAAAAKDFGSLLPFYLAYQGRDDRELQTRFGRLFARIMAAGHPQYAERPPMPPADGRIRVGMATGFFRAHSVWKLFGGWVRHLDRARFELYGYSTVRRQAVTDDARAAFDSFFDGGTDVEMLAAAIRADRLHVLIYPDIGMDPTSARLAALRLAPVQAMSWGHPETSGLPTIDYFLSSDLMEPASAERSYTETLVRLPNLSVHYEPPPVAPGPFDRPAHGIRPDAVTYLCCQSLTKYLPQHDDVFVRIAKGVPQAQFIFIAHRVGHALTRERLSAAFANAGLDPARHLVFVPTLSAAAYAGLNAACDIYLDSIEWSGGNTTLEAVAAGLPIVTLPGALMRGRHTAGILRMMELDDIIAADKDGYVEIAVRLGREPETRKATAARIVARRSQLYADMAPVRELERHIERWVRT